MRYIFKELRRHSLRTIMSITGYAVATIEELSIGQQQKVAVIRTLGTAI